MIRKCWDISSCNSRIFCQIFWWRSCSLQLLCVLCSRPRTGERTPPEKSCGKMAWGDDSGFCFRVGDIVTIVWYFFLASTFHSENFGKEGFAASDFAKEDHDCWLKISTFLEPKLTFMDEGNQLILLLYWIHTPCILLSKVQWLFRAVPVAWCSSHKHEPG